MGEGNEAPAAKRLRRSRWVQPKLTRSSAPDAESVREALHSAGIPFERVWSAQVFDAGDYPELQEKLDRVRDKLATR
jgi:hypothetical protein